MLPAANEMPLEWFNNLISSYSLVLARFRWKQLVIIGSV
jgi:hypothetical protein